MSKPLYKITFLNHGRVYELYARHVASSALWGFTEVSGLEFDVRDGVLVDPTEERLREARQPPLTWVNRGGRKSRYLSVKATL